MWFADMIANFTDTAYPQNLFQTYVLYEPDHSRIEITAIFN